MSALSELMRYAKGVQAIIRREKSTSKPEVVHVQSVVLPKPTPITAGLGLRKAKDGAQLARPISFGPPPKDEIHEFAVQEFRLASRKGRKRCG